MESIDERSEITRWKQSSELFPASYRRAVLVGLSHRVTAKAIP